MTGPIVYLPPDDMIGEEVSVLSDAIWSIPKEFSDLVGEDSGLGTKVAVLDTGMTSHELLPEPLDARSFIAGESWRDTVSGHGTHCAGTILARRRSGFPVIGVAPAATLLVGKVLSNGGSGSSQAITDGIRWAVNAGADVISMSLGSPSPYAPMQKAIQEAWEAGCVVVSAAGNSGFTGSRNTIGFPAKFPESLCIGAYQRNGQRASFSSGGRELDIMCPGQDIISCSIRNSLVSMSGTSMATPWAAGFFAYLISRMRRQGRAAFTGIEAVRQFLAINCLDQGATGKDDFTGWGIPNAPQMTKAISLTLKWLSE
jgi:subtilisin